MHKLIYALFGFLLACYSADSLAKTYNGNHTFYFDNRDNTAIEVYYEGSYQYDYSKRKWRPNKGSYSFSAICRHQYSCNTRYEAEKTMMDFKTALVNNALYTISFETSPGEFLPGKPCTQPLSEGPIDESSTLMVTEDINVYSTNAVAKRNAANKESTISSDLLNLTNAENTAVDVFKKVFDGEKDQLNFVIITTAQGKFKNACYVSDNGVCKEAVEVEESGNGFSAEYKYDPSNTVEKSFSDMLQDLFINQPKYQCFSTETCSRLQNGNMQCVASYTCSY